MFLVLIVVIVLIGIVILINLDFISSSAKRNISIFKLSIPIKNILENLFDYYKKLSETEKKIFITRVSDFINSKKFIGDSGFVVTLEMKVLISAAAAQITFGLNELLFTMFHTIIIHEDIYLNRFTRKYHKGDVNTKGVISLSWKHFVEGYKYADDKVNLGIHEMAHVLFLNRKEILFQQKYSKHFFDKFIIVSQKTFYQLRNSQSNLIRDYAKTNFAEFFSAITEMFFEAPKEFHNTMPELYLQLCIFLNQDPLLGHYREINIQDYFNNSNIPNKEQISQSELIFAPKREFIGRLKAPFTFFSIFFTIVGTLLLINELYFMIILLLIGILFLASFSFFMVKYVFTYNIEVYNNYLIIEQNSFVSQDRLELFYENIISINSIDRISYEVKYLETGKVNSLMFELSINEKDITQLKTELLKKNIRF